MKKFLLILLLLIILSINSIATIERLDWTSNYTQTLLEEKIPRESYFYFVDIKTGIKIHAFRTGGNKHIDWEPATEKDKKKVENLSNGWSWNRRPILLIIDNFFISGSIHTMPHGRTKILSGGHFCLHLYNSRTHGSNKVDPNHKKQELIAFSYCEELILLKIKINEVKEYESKESTLSSFFPKLCLPQFPK